MLKTILIALMSLFLVSNSSDKSLVQIQQEDANTQTGTLEKVIVASGNVAMDLDLNQLGERRSKSQVKTLSFNVAPNSFFTALVFNGDLRGLEPGSMALAPQSDANLPAPLSASYRQLIIRAPPGVKLLNSSFAIKKPASCFSILKDMNSIIWPATTRSPSTRAGCCLQKILPQRLDGLQQPGQ